MIDRLSMPITHAVLSAPFIFGSLAAAQPNTPGAADSHGAANVTQELGQFDVEFENGMLTSLRRHNDRFDTQYIRPDARVGDVFLRYRHAEGEWHTLDTSSPDSRQPASLIVSPDGKQQRAHFSDGGVALHLDLTLKIRPKAIDWNITLTNHSDSPVEIGDLGIPLPISSRFRRGEPLSSAVLKHSFISGHGSFLFWMRPNSVGPYLMLIPTGNTHLEFWEAPRRRQNDAAAAARGIRDYRVFVHSAVAGAEAAAQGGRWRQPHTSHKLAPAGQAGDSRSYGFRFLWAEDYGGVRQALVDEGLVDVQVVPGMTIPSDLSATLALRTHQPIHSIEAEHVDETFIEPLGTRGDYQLFRVQFNRLGENLLTVHYGDDRHLYLEFFSTEPLETLYRKRAAFIAHSQHRDPSKWYNGLITDWNMESHVLPSPDNYDRIRGFRIYAVTCDDPGLCKPAFLAAKNAVYPAPQEIEAIDYYIENFVWGGLQRTTDETYPYAIYGIQDWKRNRESHDPGRNGQLHIWRCYDYPHVVLMYFSMYRVARQFLEIDTKLTATEYLMRAYGTAQALFTVPRKVEGWSAYGTGFYNELVIVDLIAALETEGMHDEAKTLRDHWHRKVRYFVNRRPNLFVSEYAFDSTGFESTHALAKYAVEHADEQGNDALGITRSDARQFMEKQIAANIFCRGWLEPAYYYLGSDYRGGAGNAYTLSYMSQMGGWSVLDYALHFAQDPAPYLRLGYASYLSAWALMNTGTPESNYGYWYPGPENDGGAGGGFEPAAFGTTWLGQPHRRGSWYYACEIDLGYCGALRAAATVLADDPIFGRYCFGGDWRMADGRVEAVPKDGLRLRFHAMLSSGNLHLELDSDRFATGSPIVFREPYAELEFELESDNHQPHDATLSVTGLVPGEYTVGRDGSSIAKFRARAGQPSIVRLPVTDTRHKFQIALQGEHQVN